MGFWPAVLFAIAIPEVFSVFKFQSPFEGEKWALRTDSKPGDLGFDPMGLKPSAEAELKEMQTKELNNGRLAMIGIAGMVGQERAPGSRSNKPAGTLVVAVLFEVLGACDAGR